MTAVLISYDLVNPGQDYQKVYDAIQSYGGWCHVMDSTWVVSQAGITAAGVRDKVSAATDANDKILCVDVTNDSAAWIALPSDVSGWLQKNL